MTRAEHIEAAARRAVEEFDATNRRNLWDPSQLPARIEDMRSALAIPEAEAGRWGLRWPGNSRDWWSHRNDSGNLAASTDPVTFGSFTDALTHAALLAYAGRTRLDVAQYEPAPPRDAEERYGVWFIGDTKGWRGSNWLGKRKRRDGGLVVYVNRIFRTREAADRVRVSACSAPGEWEVRPHTHPAGTKGGT